MRSAASGGALALLLDDVGWHQRRARRLSVAASLALAAGVIPMIRLVVGLRSSPTTEDPWGPVDAVLIVAGILLWSAALAGFSGARRHTRVALALAARQLVDEHGARADLGPRTGEAASPTGLARLVERRGWRVVPVDELDERDRLAQLFIAARNRPGSSSERAERFGPQVASRYARVVLVRWLVASVLFAVCAGAAVVGVAGIVAGGSARQPLVTSAVIILFAVIAVSPVIGLVLRRSPAGLLGLAGTLLPQLRAQDPTLDRAQVAAMVRKPRLYDVWLGLRSPAEPDDPPRSLGSTP